MRRFGDQVAQAAARLRFDYPTVARARVFAESLVEVGRYNGVEGRVELFGAGAERELCRWLGFKRLDPAELERSELGASSA
jgi:hypothetical protein